MLILNDFNTSVEKALSEIEPNWKELPGIIICGTHKPVEENIEKFLIDIKMARENNIPFLGICFGMQLMAIEYMKNVVGLEDATSEEFNKCELHTFQVKDYTKDTPVWPPPECTCGKFVVKKMPGLRVGLQPGMVNMKVSEESFWHNFRVDVDKFPQLWDGFEINEANEVVTWMKLKDRDNFFGVQFHPEYQSSKDKPHPILVDFINKCRGYEKVSGSSTPISDIFKKHGK